MDRDVACEQENLLYNIDIVIGILERFRNTLLESDKFENFIVTFKNTVHVPLNEIPTGIIQWAVTGKTIFLRSAECLLFFINCVKKVPVNLLSMFVRSKMLEILDSPNLELLKELSPEQHQDLIELIDTLQHLDKLLEDE